MRYGILALLLCTGCSMFRRPVVTAPCPPPPFVQHPQLRIHQLQGTASMAEILTAYVLDLAEVDGYSRRLEALLDAYRPPPEPAKKVEKPK